MMSSRWVSWLIEFGYRGYSAPAVEVIVCENGKFLSAHGSGTAAATAFVTI